MARPPSVLRVLESSPEPEDLGPITVDVPSNEIAPGVTLDAGVMHVEHGDGTTTIDFAPSEAKSSEQEKDDFFRNLVGEIEESKLNEIASSLMDGIKRDIESRKEWLETRARGIQLLGLHLEEPKGEATGGREGTAVSSVRHPLLLEATIRFQAMARGELLPATGPVKVRNDTPAKSPSQLKAEQAQPTPGSTGNGAAGAGPGIGLPGAPVPAPAMPFQQGGAVPGLQQLMQGMQQSPATPAPAAPTPPPGTGLSEAAKPPANPAQAAAPFATEIAIPPSEERDSLAAALETDFNHYLTVTAPEYVPDTDRMLFYIGFGGDGFKKVYNCPLRRRPVSESVDADDLIVSNSATDLKNCGRVTHAIKMRKSILKRMQILGVYADVDLSPPSLPESDPVQEKKQEIDGNNPFAKKPEDLDYEIYESYCELELDTFAPAKFKEQGLPLPYRVTLEKDSRKILSVVRNWNEGDEQCLPKQFFVQFPFIRGLGFYGLGFVHVLGNLTTALTAMLREATDAGMFANFPGFLFAKGAGRQLSNQFRVPPGGGVGLDVPTQMRIQDAVMPVPYKDVSPAFTAFAQWIEQGAQRLAQTAQISVGEGKQDAPVGTTLALIEQATKILDSVHKRLHWAQSEEFMLLKDRFREDPEAFWRHNKRPSLQWERDQFIQALDDYNLVPVADPNNPTSLHRAAKAAMIEGLATKYPQLINQEAALKRVFRIAGIDDEGLFYPEPLPPPPDPRMVAIQQKAQSTAQTTQAQAQTAVAKAMANVIVTLKQLEEKAADRASKQQLEQVRLLMEAMDKDNERQNAQGERAGEHLMRMSELQADRAKKAQEMEAERASRIQELRMGQVEKAQQMRADAIARERESRMDAVAAAREHEAEQQRHEAEMRRREEEFQQKLRHERELHEAKLEQERAMARLANKKKRTDNSNE